jgi:glutamate formiminotransferase/formiminotetrahydrofolate cyclodeaminase
MGLEDVGPFEPAKAVLGLPHNGKGALVSMPVAALADEVSRPTPAPGGGSIAALAGALAASLGAMVGNLTQARKGMEDVHEEMEQVARGCQSLKDELLAAVDADTEAFNDVLAAMRLPKGSEEESRSRAAAIQQGYKQATMVPLRTAELCLEAMRQCALAADKGLPASVTDAGVGALLGRAAVLGALDNVRINLPSIDDAAWVAERKTTLAAMAEEADALEARVRTRVEAALAG